MVPTALNGRDAVVQFEGSMFASFSEMLGGDACGDGRAQRGA
jgi:hypothetical protein